MGEILRVEAKEILSETGMPSLSPPQEIGIRGALLSGGLAAGVLPLLLGYWLSQDPRIPVIPDGVDEKTAAMAVARYKDLR